MAVKDSLMGILTLGPAYGLQLHSELCARAPHRARTNVGQIYATLERLVSAGYVLRSGSSTEGFPLYTLTDVGDALAQAWLSGETVTSFTEWPEFLDHIMVARSLNDSTLEKVISVYESILSSDPPPHNLPVTAEKKMIDLAQRHITDAALAWLGDIRRDLRRRANPARASGAVSPDAIDGQIVTHGYREERPKRGRPTLS